MVLGAVSRIGSRVGSRISSNAAAAGGAGIIGGTAFGDLTGTSPVDILPGSSAGSTGTSGGGSGMTIVWVFVGIALLAVVSNLSGDS